MRSGRRRGVAPAVAGVVAMGAAWAALEALDGARFLDLLTGAAAGATALFLVRLRARQAAGGARRTGGAGAGGARGGGGDEALDGDAVADGILEVLRHRLDADRLVVWRLDAARTRLEPARVAGPAPAPLAAAGQPILWALSHQEPLRLDPRPRWAVSRVLAVPVSPGPDGAVLTVERDPPPPLDLAREAATLAGAALRLTGRERRALVVNQRFDRLLEFLDRLPGDSEPGHFPRELARAAAEIAGARGALVASWDGESGRVLERYGDGGGPAAGTYFGIMAGDVAMAARAGSTLRRDRAEGRVPPLVDAGERWAEPPAQTAAVPLIDAGGSPRGAIGLWTASTLADEGLALLRALAPLLALQLVHSRELVRYREAAHVDSLTGLGSRAALEDRLREESERFHRYRRPFALMVIDLDHFKRINDTHGHPAGDAVLARVGEIVRTVIRDADYAARFGGEEIVVVLPETLRTAATDAAGRVRTALERARFEWGGEPIHVTASIGVSACPECTDDPGQVLRTADEALYEAKHAGRNRVVAASLAATLGGR